MYHNFRVVFNRLVLFFGLLLSPHSVLVFVARCTLPDLQDFSKGVCLTDSSLLYTSTHRNVE
jgi:hypothetical protein